MSILFQLYFFFIRLFFIIIEYFADVRYVLLSYYNVLGLEIRALLSLAAMYKGQFLRSLIFCRERVHLL